MKSLNKLFIAGLVFVMGGLAVSCTDLDITTDSEYTTDNFPKTSEDYEYIMGPVYSTIARSFSRDYWISQLLPTDQAILLSHATGWWDGGRYQQLHQHTWTPDHDFITGAFNALFAKISTCSSVKKVIEDSEDSTLKTQFLADLRAMRAMYYFMLMDSYGDLPLVTEFGQPTGNRVSRTEICKFIEKEFLEVMPNLKSEVNSSTYARPTQYVAHAMLAKLYLNWEVYTGQSIPTEKVIEHCNAIIASEQFNLSDSYKNVFNYNNGSQIKDIIYAFPYNRDYTNEEWYYCRYWHHKYHKETFGYTWGPSSGMRCLPSFYAKFNLKGDEREQIWLKGKQYKKDGSPYYIKLSKKAFDCIEFANTPGDTLWWFELTNELKFRKPEYESTFNMGNDERDLAMGYRANKYCYDELSSTREQDNDMCYLRFADILLMKAEAIARGGVDPQQQSPVELINMVRQRANAELLTEETYNRNPLEEIYNERCRELVHELWCRNDMIRFGKFEGTWEFKTVSDINRRIFPIPRTVLQNNPTWKQNPSY